MSTPSSKTASSDRVRRQPTFWTRKRLGIALALLFAGGITAAALDLRYVIGGSPRRVEPNSVLVLDPQTMATVANPKGGFAAPAVVRSGGLVWTVDAVHNRVIGTNPLSKRVFRNEVVGTSPIAVATGFGAAWVANAGNGSISRVPLASGKIETIGLDDQPSAIATGDGYVWVVSQRSRKVLRIDPTSKQVDKTVRLANPPLAVVVHGLGRVAVSIGH